VPFDEEAFKRQAELAGTNPKPVRLVITYECPKCQGDKVFFGKRKSMGFFKKFPLCVKCDEIMDERKTVEY